MCKYFAYAQLLCNIIKRYMGEKKNGKNIDS